MRICDYCQTEIEDGYLGDDIYVMCDKCVHDVYTKEEFEVAYEKGELFWTVFYDTQI